jgi:MarR family transcriptional regulator, lower aerobic nicotinate degradation pathway regulator
VKTRGEDIDGELVLAARLRRLKRFVAGWHIERPDDRCMHEGSRKVVGDTNQISWYSVLGQAMIAVMADRAETPNLTDALVELSFLIQATLGRLASERELSLTQVRLLGILRDREPGIVELADVLNLDKSSVSGLVDRAQRRGLVERASSKTTDGRAIRVLLTEPGRRMASQFAERVSGELAELVKDLSTAQRERLARQAARIVTSSGMSGGLEPPRTPLSRGRSEP